MLALPLVILIYVASTIAAPVYLKKAEPSGFVQFKFDPEILTAGPGFYTVELEIGSDNQTVSLRIDTTSTDLWVNSENNEFCDSYLPLPTFLNSSSDSWTEWNEFSGELRDDFLSGLESFQEQQASQVAQLSQVSASSFPTKSMESYFSQKNQYFTSYINVEKETIASKISDWAKSINTAGNGQWNSFASGVVSNGRIFATDFTSKNDEIATSVTRMAGQFASQVTSVGDEIFTLVTARAESFATKVTSDGGQFATRVTSEGGQIITAITSKGGSFATKVTSEGEQFATKVTSEGGQFATKVTSQFGNVETSITKGWDDFTSGFLGGFGSILDFAVEPKTANNQKVTFTFIPTEISRSPVSTISSHLPTESALDDSEIDIYNAFIYDLQMDCSKYGTFNTSSSTSFESDDELYVSEKDFVVGFIGNDSVTLSNAVLSNVSMAIVDESDSNVGILGIGQQVKGRNSTFRSFPYVLSEQGIINKPMYSLSLSGYTPSIIFGAIDLSSFESNITLVPIVNDTEAITITLSSIGISYSNESAVDEYIIAEGKAAAIISTINENVLLPENVLSSLASQINNTFGIVYNEFFSRYVITVGGHDGKYDDNLLENFDITFDFQGFPINIPLSTFLIPVSDAVLFNTSSSFNSSLGNSSFYVDLDDDVESGNIAGGNQDDNQNIDYNSYILSISSSYTEKVVLGLDFLKSVYTVVDLQNNQVGLAPSANLTSAYSYNSTTSFVIIQDRIPFAYEATDYDGIYGVGNITKLTIT